MYTIPADFYTEIAPLLQEELDTSSIENLREQLAKLNAVQYSLAETLADCHQSLLKARERARMPKGGEFTEFDRKTMLDASTNVIQRDYDFLMDIRTIVSERITLGVAFLQTI